MLFGVKYGSFKMNFSLEDSTTDIVPPKLEEIARDVVKNAKCCESIQKDLLFVLIIVLMMENGFHPITNEGDPVYVDSKCLENWKSSSILNAKFTLFGFNEIPLNLIISPLGPTALINVVIDDLNFETYTVCVPVSRYVVSPHASTIPMIFRDLKHLSNSFKNNISAPVKSRILNLYGYPSASIIGLPEEVYYKFTQLLPVKDVVTMSQTCRRLKCLNDNQSLWRDLYRRDFKEELPSEQSENSDWKAFYKETYVAKRDASLRRTAGTLHDFMDYSDLVAHIDNPLWDNMII